MSVGVAQVALQFILSLKKGTATFNFRSNEPPHDILGLLDRYNAPEKKEKRKNTHP
jgi:hypothetical protein